MSSKLPVVGYRQVIAALKRVGFIEVRGRGKGSHTFLFREEPACGLTIPRQNPIRRGTLRAIIRQAGLSVDEFVNLL